MLLDSHGHLFLHAFAQLRTRIFRPVRLLAVSIAIFSSTQALDTQAETLTFLVQNSQPKYFLHQGNKLGLCGEIYFQLSKKLKQRGVDSTVSPHYIPIKRIFSMVETGPSYAFCGSSRTTAREKRFDFIDTPLYLISYALLGHKDEQVHPANFDELKATGGTVGALFGTQSAQNLKKKLGHQVNDSFQEFDTPLRMMSTPPYRLRYFYYHDLGLNYMAKETGLPLKVLNSRFKTRAQFLIHSKNLKPEIVRALVDTMEEMEKSGELDKIVQKYIY